MESTNAVSEKLSLWLVSSIQGIVLNPNDVQVEAKQDEMGLLFLIKVHRSDMGRLIGTKGAHSSALRTLLRCAAGNNEVRAAMKIEEPPGSRFGRETE